jgi:hypothetical protein
VADLRVQAQAPAGEWGPPLTVDSSDFGNVSQLRLGRDAAGRACAVWVQSDGLRTAVWFSRETAASTWSVPETLATASQGDAMSPDLTLLSDGSLLVVWAEFDGQQIKLWSNRLY